MSRADSLAAAHSWNFEFNGATDHFKIFISSSIWVRNLMTVSGGVSQTKLDPDVSTSLSAQLETENR